MGVWDELIDEASTVTASCQDCDWHQEGTGETAVREAVREGDRHAAECRHHVKAEVLV